MKLNYLARVLGQKVVIGYIIIQLSSQKLDSAMKINEKYITYTATSIYQSNELWWFAGAGDIKADSTEEAILIGKNIMNNANIQIDVNATKVGNEYICNYGPGYIQARGKNLS